MLVVLINFTSENNRYYLYQNMIKILNQNKNEMEVIKSCWTGEDFSNDLGIQKHLKELYEYLIERIAKSTSKIDPQLIEETHFTIKCPECSNEATLLVPKNIEKLLKMMHAVNTREARFVCCIAFAGPGGDVHVFHGSVIGYIGTEAKGRYGFGYDPVFYPAGSDRTFAEMGDSEKDAISHRGRALEAFKKFIRQWIFRESHRNETI